MRCINKLQEENKDLKDKCNIASLDDLHIISGIKCRNDRSIEEGDTVQIRFDSGAYKNAIFYFATDDGCLFNLEGNMVKL